MHATFSFLLNVFTDLVVPLSVSDFITTDANLPLSIEERNPGIFNV